MRGMAGPDRLTHHPGIETVPTGKMAASGQTALTDQELRAELKRLGFKAGPVTDSTRQVYLKKLGELQVEEKLKATAPKPPIPGRKLLGFSSDESDGESSATGSNRRRSMPSQSKALRRRSTKAWPQTPYNGTADEHVDLRAKQPASGSSSLNPSTKSKRYSTGILPSGRSSLPEAGNKSRAERYVRHPANRVTIAKVSVTPKKDDFSDSDVDGNDQDDAEDAEINTGSAVNTKATNTSTSKEINEEPAHITNPLNQTYTKDHEASDLSQTGKRSLGLWWSTSKPSPRRSLPTSTPRTSTPRKSDNRLRLSDAYDDEIDTSKFSATQNNSKVLAPEPRNSLNSRYPDFDHSTPNSSKAKNKSAPKTSGSVFLNSKSNHMSGGHLSSSQPTNFKSASTAPRSTCSSSFQEEEENLYEEFATEDHSASSLGARIGHYVPMILLGCAFLFFIVLAMVYMNVGTGKLADMKYIADSSSNDIKRHTEAMRIVQSLYDKLSEVAGKYECGSQDVTSRNMSLEEVLTFLKFEFKKDIQGNKHWIAYHLEDALQKIINNPEWGLRLFDKNGEGIQANVDPADQAGHAVKLAKQTAWLESQHLNMSWLCRVQRSAFLVLLRLFLLCAVVLFLWLVYKFMMYRIRRDKEEKKQVHQLVDAITEMLASHHKACSKDKSLSPYLAIPHIRDTLIPLKHRKEKQHLWDRAVQFINTNESRVRVETQQISGEEFPVWRWMLPSPVVSSFTPMTELELNPNRVKVWQGTAFDNLDTAIKAPRYTPTPCLKIRNMFDPTLESDGDWHVAIEDAILERCGDNGGIVHVAVDRNSREGCVYVKCATPENAGRAYRALQGSWFDGKLVTVKYLRLDRYHQRFPYAIGCNTPIRPSNNLKKSLSHQSQSPGLEAS
ncbi:inner nuclear membrane protein Man1-like [Acanthaster planci]|uniref:LEM domain-containing protein 2 n=1 Tax=Acanthaster planci TaxID=133434 RepID=A0A8B7XQS2_ACAPL|nr:inner nuclear membrane protein Man1-like [Acanthaster planci]